MTRFRQCKNVAIMMFVAGGLLFLAGMGRSQAGPQALAQADELFGRGQFDQAAVIYAGISGRDPGSYGAALGLGRIFILRNSLSEAETWLKKATDLKPQEREPLALMGEVLYRRNEFVEAAAFFEAAGRKAKAEALKAFRGRTPFLIESGPDLSYVNFVQTDPLPLIKLAVNGQEGTFLIDTGGWELHVMPAFAEKSGLEPLLEGQVGVYAGGLKAGFLNAIADRVRLGEFSLRNVPVVIPQGPAAPIQIDGIVGTVVLYQFLFTLDYPGDRLILRRNTPAMSAAVQGEAKAAEAVRVPFWLAGDHFVFAWGTANGAGPYLFLVDTGMAGGGFSCPEHVIDEAKIELPKDGLQGMGAGGPITIYPFTVDLTLGETRRDKVQGLYGALPPGFDDRLGFRTGGIISHGFFRPFAVTFDFQSMTLYLETPVAADEDRSVDARGRNPVSYQDRTARRLPRNRGLFHGAL